MPPKIIGWRHWYHLTLGTYGHWLPGDPRSWRERHHRRHVPGSHRHPPPPSDRAQRLHEYARGRMTRPPFAFAPDDLATIGSHLLDSLRIQQAPIAAISVAKEHCHLLVRCEDDKPRDCSGNLKVHIYHRMFADQASPWEKGSHEEPIKDLAHGRWTFGYILDHEKEGAWVWGFRKRVTGI
ncbi:MAG TPA: hypothetical protein VHQ47_11190 [Phycisphaerae bacterium]|jgi:hypothetical protein|nr:hypothetical protein [Phycisphaerae bacterium]